MEELIIIYFSRELDKKFTKMEKRDKKKLLKLITLIVATNGGYEQETISTNAQSIRSSPRGHVPNRALWFKMENSKYFFINYFPKHEDYEDFLKMLKTKYIKFSYIDRTELYRAYLNERGKY